MIRGGDNIFIATGNGGKVSEFVEILSGYDLSIFSALDFADYEFPIEDGSNFSENALLKARHGFSVSGMVSIADDSGLCCLGLGGEPGVLTSRFGGDISYDEKVCLLWERLGDSDKSASFCCVIACVFGLDSEVIFRGDVHGVLRYPLVEVGGWGYDPYFVPFGYACSFAGLSVGEKNRISHRGVALGRMIEGLFG